MPCEHERGRIQQRMGLANCQLAIQGCHLQILLTLGLQLAPTESRTGQVHLPVRLCMPLLVGPRRWLTFGSPLQYSERVIAWLLQRLDCSSRLPDLGRRRNGAPTSFPTLRGRFRDEPDQLPRLVQDLSNFKVANGRIVIMHF